MDQQKLSTDVPVMTTHQCFSGTVASRAAPLPSSCVDLNRCADKADRDALRTTIANLERHVGTSATSIDAYANPRAFFPHQRL